MACKKKIAKWIREQTKKLPPDEYWAAMKYSELRKEKGEDGKMRMVGGEVDKFPVNHARRAKRAFKRRGLEGLSAYFLKYGFKLIRG